MFERSLEEYGIRHKGMEFSSCNSLRACLQRGLGVTLCPIVSIKAELREGGLQVLNLQKSFTSIIMIRHVDKWCSPLLSRFMEIVIARMH